MKRRRSSSAWIERAVIRQRLCCAQPAAIIAGQRDGRSWGEPALSSFLSSFLSNLLSNFLTDIERGTGCVVQGFKFEITLTDSCSRIPSDTIGYHRIPSGTIWYHRVPSGTIGYHRVPSGTIGYHRIRGDMHYHYS